MTGIIYERGYEIIEIKILDGSGYVIEKFKFSVADKRLGARIFDIIRRKYGVDAKPTIPSDNSWIKE